jgi:AmmeMemoRadiSam system protein A
MTKNGLTEAEKKTLLGLARETIKASVAGRSLPSVPAAELTENLRAPGASFVTLTIAGDLRGCIGSLQAFRPLYEDVQAHALDAAFQDYRFLPVTTAEVPLLEIEISHLTAPEPLEYSRPEELPEKLHPGQDGVVLRDGVRSATFLPQVWEQLPTPQEFLSHLCLKMGAAADLWRHRVLQVSIYHVDEFHEEEMIK